MVEFAFTLLLSVPLIMGLLAVGIRYVRELKVSQISRDLANMYSRGVNFNATGALGLVQRLGPGFDFSSTGNAVAILSEVRKVTGDECDAAGIARASCNAEQAVFEQRFVFGNTAVRASNFGTPVDLQADHTTLPADQLRKSEEVAKGFLRYLALEGARSFVGPSGATVTLAPEHAYVVEVAVNTNDLNIPGFMAQTQVYSRNIF
jgi:hypothetical protein